MNSSFDFILAAGAIIIGLMLLTGHGSIFMKGGDPIKRKKLYDEEKMERGSGVALLVIGVATAIDHYTTSMPAKIGYVAVIALCIICLVFYVRTKCKKK